MGLAAGDGEVVDPRPLAGVEGAGLHGGEQRVGLVGLGLDHHPAAEAVLEAEMSVVGGVSGQPVAIVEQRGRAGRCRRRAGIRAHSHGCRSRRRPHAPPWRARRRHRGSTIADGRCRRKRRRRSPGRRVQPGLLLAGRREIRRQSGGEDVPDLTVAVGRRMDFGAEDGGEAVGAERQRIGDGEAVAGEEVVGQAQEVVAGVAIEPADLLRLKPAVGEGRMRVDVAPPEPAGRLKGSRSHVTTVARVDGATMTREGAVRSSRAQTSAATSRRRAVWRNSSIGARAPSRIVCQKVQPLQASSPCTSAPTLWIEPMCGPAASVPSARTSASWRARASVSFAPGVIRPVSTSEPKAMRGSPRLPSLTATALSGAGSTAAMRAVAAAM